MLKIINESSEGAEITDGCQQLSATFICFLDTSENKCTFSRILDICFSVKEEHTICFSAIRTTSWHLRTNILQWVKTFSPCCQPIVQYVPCSTLWMSLVTCVKSIIFIILTQSYHWNQSFNLFCSNHKNHHVSSWIILYNC